MSVKPILEFFNQPLLFLTNAITTIISLTYCVIDDECKGINLIVYKSLGDTEGFVFLLSLHGQIILENDCFYAYLTHYTGKNNNVICILYNL